MALLLACHAAQKQPRMVEHFPRECLQGREIANSDRTADNPCTGTINTTCKYACLPGYLASGRHVCQHYEAGGKLYVNSSFIGGQCHRLCTNTVQSCRGQQATIRTNISDAIGPCLATRCMVNADAALRNVALGNLAVWRQGRSERSGFYRDSVNIIDPDDGGEEGLDLPRTIESLTSDLRVAVEAGNSQAAVGVTGLGLITEIIALEMGQQSMSETISRVRLTLRSLLGRTKGVQALRDPRGFFVHFMDIDTGSAPSATTSCLMCTGLLMAGALFCRNYLEKAGVHRVIDGGKSEGEGGGGDSTGGKGDGEGESTGSAEVVELVDELWESIQFESILCADGVLSRTGTAIPMTLSLTGDECGPAWEPDQDGFYQFNEEHYTVWFAFEKACGSQPEGSCRDAAIEAMWRRWQGRRTHPNHVYRNLEVLSDWSGYVVQLPYYTTHSFHADPAYQKLFRNQWQADRTYFNVSAHASERGRYGLGAGPVAPWCSDGAGYAADLLSGKGKSHCRIYSPYITAGYLPAAPGQIRAQLLELLEDGESVVPVPATDYVVLWRRSLLDLGWPDKMDGATARFTMVDLSSELLGLSTLFLPPGFYADNTDYFRRGGASVVRGAEAADGAQLLRADEPVAQQLTASVKASALELLVRTAICAALLLGGSFLVWVLVKRWRNRREYRVVK